jgi:hypothetical protein
MGKPVGDRGKDDRSCVPSRLLRKISDVFPLALLLEVRELTCVPLGEGCSQRFEFTR